MAKYDVKATFFVVGDWVDKYPESVKALSDAGHAVMNHSNTHGHYPQMSAEEVIADLNACNDKVEAVTGVRPTLVRFPYGDYDDNSINAARSIGMEPIQWDVEALAAGASGWADAKDWTMNSKEQIKALKCVSFQCFYRFYDADEEMYDSCAKTQESYI